jgi:hypothetical protein
MKSFYGWLISEMGMKNPQDLNSEVVTIQNNKKNGQIFISIYKDTSLSENIVSAFLYKVEQYFGIHIQTKEDYISQGYGILLYDVAIEYATMKGQGLVSTAAARLFKDAKVRGNHHMGATSNQAARVYEYYYEKRPDVKKIPIKTNSDNSILPPYLLCIYQKSPEKINELKANKKLFINKELNKIHDFLHSDVEYEIPYYSSGNIEKFISHFILKSPELNSQLQKKSRRNLLSPDPDEIEEKFVLFGEKYNEIHNLVYNYIRKFYQIKDQPYVKEKDVTKYSWKDLKAIVDYAQTTTRMRATG